MIVGPPIGALVDRAGMETALGALGLLAFSVFSRAHHQPDAGSA